MNKFEYYNPTRILFGEGQILRINKLIPEKDRVLVLYGGGSAKRTGTLDEVLSALGSCEIFTFGGIEPNPEYDTLIKAVELIKKEKIDFLLAVGGGSVIDGTKFIAAAVFIDDPWQILKTFGKIITKALPFGTVLTIPATGSEMNSGSVITRREKKTKLPFSNPLLFPSFSILDPSKSLTLPPRQVANGIVDAFVHITEQYLTFPADAKVQDGYSEALLNILINEGPLALSEPQNMSVRANLMWTATMALNGLIGAGVPSDWSTHMIGHEITALYGIDHARTLAVVLPGLWHVLRKEKKEKLLQYAKHVWKISKGNEDERIYEAITRTENFFISLDIPVRLKDYDLDETHIEEIINQLKAHGMTALGENRNITPEIVKAILLNRL
ncbi:MAG: NADH-dependent alcohol dehydrogenase [Deltaproteobacteria bacterium]|nr:MAG: NADH-dependent alcohol dehydrogenase [Deltaproteobacteria bacterium]